MHTEKTQHNTPGRPKDLAKRQAILEAAKCLFLHNGYQGTSMDAVAGAAGVSKLTVYSHFKDKEGLYAAAIADACESRIPAELFEQPTQTPIAQVLLQVGLAFSRLIYSQESIALHRTLISSTENNTLAKLFYEQGPVRLFNGMTQVLQRAHHAQQLHIPAPQQAAEHFFSLIQGMHQFRLLIGYSSAPEDSAVRRHVDEVIELFLRAYRIP